MKRRDPLENNTLDLSMKGNAVGKLVRSSSSRLIVKSSGIKQLLQILSMQANTPLGKVIHLDVTKDCARVNNLAMLLLKGR
jgi:hypothetical protein